MQTNKYISEELLASYIDGTTTQEENDYILEIFRNNPLEFEAFNIAYQAANFIDDELSHIENNQIDDDKGTIHPLLLGGGIAAGTIIGNVFEFSHIPMVAANNDENNLINDRFINNNESISKNDNNHDMNTTIHEAPNQFGEEANNYVSPNVNQGYSDTCAVRSQQLVLNDFGIPVTQEDLIKEATQHGWYAQGEGTPMEYVGNLLENHGVEVNRLENANIFNLTNELAQGHKVIIGVDANELWNNGFWQQTKDSVIGETPNHALIVAGIDTSDPQNVQVILKDPGTGDVAKAYPMEQFMDAWKDSHCFMVSTEEPAPLKFNQETMMGFDYDKGYIENAETLLTDIEELPDITDFDTIHHNSDPNLDLNHYPDQFDPDEYPVNDHPDSNYHDDYSDNDHHDDLDILHFDHNI